MKKSVKLIYSNGDYEVRHHKNFRGGRKYRIVNVKNGKLHTHRYSKKESVDLANFAKYKKIPQGANVDYLESLSRIVDDLPMKHCIEELIHTKVDKKKGNQKHYVNIQKGPVYNR